MSVIRTVHNKENPYVMINKSAIEDNRLSFKALGLWAWTMAKPTDWVFYVEQIAKDRKEGRKAIYTAIQELIETGYCLRVQHREKNPETGKYLFTNIEYFFFEFQVTPEYLEEFKKRFPLSHFGHAHDGHAQKEQLLNNNNILSNKNTNNPLPPKGEAANAAPPVSSSSSSSKKLEKEEKLKEPKVEKIPVSENVSLTQEQIDSLKNEFGSTEAVAMVKTLSNYKHASGKRYKSDYHALIGWVKDRHLESKSKKIVPLQGKMSLPTDGIIDGPDAAWRKKKL